MLLKSFFVEISLEEISAMNKVFRLQQPKKENCKPVNSPVGFEVIILTLSSCRVALRTPVSGFDRARDFQFLFLLIDRIDHVIPISQNTTNDPTVDHFRSPYSQTNDLNQ